MFGVIYLFFPSGIRLVCDIPLGIHMQIVLCASPDHDLLS